MKLSLGQAAKEVEMSKAGILKAIKTGRLSAERSDAGGWLIDPSELFRVYPKVNRVNDNLEGEVNVGKPQVNSALEREIELLREQVTALKNDKDGLVADKEDLKSQRDKVMKLLEENMATVKQLTDQRQEKPEEKKGFLGRLFG